MKQYAWPGNLRELRNVVEHAVILAGTDQVAPDDLPINCARPSPRPTWKRRR